MKPNWLTLRGTQGFFRSLPWRSRLVIFLAVFFTFGTVGFIDDIRTVRHLTPWPCVWTNVVFVGLLAVFYLLTVTVSRKLIPAAVAFQLLAQQYVVPGVCGLFARPGAAESLDMRAIEHRLQLDGLGCLVCVVLGYAVFIRFIAWEGRRHMRLRTEVALAQRIHSTLVPPVALETPRFEAFGRSEPSSEVGGDLIDVVERDGGLVACVADVSGHGVSAGAFMGMVKSAFRMKLLASDRLDDVLDDLNEVVCQIRSPEMFVTFAGLRFDPTSDAELALAGHLPILHYCRATGAVAAIDNQRPPLGVVPHQRHATSRVAFQPGDLFVMITDGFTEVVNGRGEQFGTGGVEDVIRQQVQKPLGDIYASLLAAVRRHGPQADDQTLLLVRAR